MNLRNRFKLPQFIKTLFPDLCLAKYLFLFLVTCLCTATFPTAQISPVTWFWFPGNEYIHD